MRLTPAPTGHRRNSEFMLLAEVWNSGLAGLATKFERSVTFTAALALEHAQLRIGE
jgi:hypothetical protein